VGFAAVGGCFRDGCFRAALWAGDGYLGVRYGAYVVDNFDDQVLLVSAADAAAFAADRHGAGVCHR
jgi:hypothetical protein